MEHTQLMIVAYYLFAGNTVPGPQVANETNGNTEAIGSFESIDSTGPKGHHAQLALQGLYCPKI
jgi:hypothetical protein